MHFLGDTSHLPSLMLEKPRACVAVRVESKKALTVITGIHVAKADTQWVELPKTVVVMESSFPHRHIKPSKGHKFYVSTETFDPLHMVLEHT